MNKTFIFKKITYFFIFCLIIFLIDLVVLNFFKEEYTKNNSSLKIQSGERHKLVNRDNYLWNNNPFYYDKFKSYQINEENFYSEFGKIKMPPKEDVELRIFLFGGSTMQNSPSDYGMRFQEITGITNIKYKNTIDFYLKKKLKTNHKNKYITVFNASVSGQTSFHSFLQYKNLAKFDPDLVIFYDGFNDYKIINKKFNKHYLKNEFENLPQNNLKYKIIRFLSEKSGFFHLTYKKLWINNLYPENYVPNSDFIKRFIEENNYLYLSKKDLESTIKKKILTHYNRFDENYKNMANYFKNNEVKYLLIKQASILHRNYSSLSDKEKAVYLQWLTFDDKYDFYREINHFQRLIISNFKEDKENNIFYPFELIQSKKNIFTDYCHLTSDGNEILANYIYKKLINLDLLGEINN